MAASEQHPIDLYYWPTPNGWKITIMLEECGLPYAVHPVNIGKGDQFQPEFLAISPNNKMPAIVDPDGPDGRPISVFESGAILQYLGRKTGRFYPQDERGRVEVEQWLFWQMGGFGPMLGQTHHFRIYAPEKIPYAIDRYTNEANRLYGVLNKRLADREFVAGDYSIADMAIAPWAKLWDRQGQNIDEFPHAKRWLQTVLARPAVQRGIAVSSEDREKTDLTDPKVQAVLFGQEPVGLRLAAAAAVAKTLLDEQVLAGADPFSRRDGWRSHGVATRRLEFDLICDRFRSRHTDDPIIDSAGCVGPFRIEWPSHECRFGSFLLVVCELSACRFNVHSQRIDPICAMSSTTAYGDLPMQTSKAGSAARCGQVSPAQTDKGRGPPQRR